MTIIVASLELMASDSRVSSEDGSFYTAKKIFIAKDGAIVGAAGDGGDCSRFVEWAQGGWRTRPKFSTSSSNDEESMEALILRKDGLYYFAPDYPSPEKLEDPFHAIGSGAKAAMVAMRFEPDPIRAVERVFEVDHNCGPPIQVIHLSEAKGG